jgi:hypothetical protein
MPSWDSLIRFEAAEDGGTYWAALALDTVPVAGLKVPGFVSIEALERHGSSRAVTVKKVERVMI